MRAGNGFFIIELVFSSHLNLSDKVLLPSKKVKVGIQNKALNENPATDFVKVSITSKPLDFMHAVASSPFAPRNCPLPLKSIIFTGNFRKEQEEYIPLGFLDQSL